MHAIAAAALEGRLDTEALRMREVAEVGAELRGFEGIGPFYSELVTMRALGHTDVLPTSEPRVLAATAARLGRGVAEPGRLRRGRAGLAAVAHLGVRRPARRRLTADDGVSGATRRQARSAARLIASASDAHDLGAAAEVTGDARRPTPRPRDGRSGRPRRGSPATRVGEVPREPPTTIVAGLRVVHRPASTRPTV